ncbi:MAG TPA: GNAT family N-acetyltransferase [Ktedonobacteraceae bacterium]|nr:GNAT family N-acetyltransferase [Ktedonobacteraceae bacterium]
MREDQTMQIETARLLLRDFTEDDLSAVYAFDSDPELKRYRGGGKATEEETRGFIQKTQHWLKQEPRSTYALALVLKERAEIIGVICLTITWRERGEAELWYRLSRTFWNQGYITEAASAMLAFGFIDLQLHRIWAMCHPDNTGSWRVMEKIGMSYEGRMRENFPNEDGTWRDSLLYAIIDHAWRSKQNTSS